MPRRIVLGFGFRFGVVTFAVVVLSFFLQPLNRTGVRADEKDFTLTGKVTAGADDATPPDETKSEHNRFLEIDSGGHNGNVTWLGFTSDGKRLLSADDESVVRVWDVGNPRRPTLRRTLHVHHGTYEGGVRAGALSPKPMGSGRQLLAIATDSSMFGSYFITLVDVDKGNVLGLLEGHIDWINSLSFSSDGRLLCSASDDDTILVWDLEPLFRREGPQAGWLNSIQQTCQVLEGHEDGVTCAIFLPSEDEGTSSRLASAGGGGGVIFWERRPNGRWRKSTSLESDGTIGSLAATADGSILVSGSYDGWVELWDADTEEYNTDISEDEEKVLVQVAVSPDGKSVLTTGWSDDTAWVLRTRNGKDIAQFDKHLGTWCGAWSPTGNFVAIAGYDEDFTATISLWDPKSGAELSHMSGTGQDVNGVAISPDGSLIAFGTTWDDDQGDYLLEHTFDLHRLQPGGDPDDVEPRGGWHEDLAEYGGLSAEANNKFTKLIIRRDNRKVGEIFARDEDVEDDDNSIVCWTFVPGATPWIVVGTDDWLRMYDIENIEDDEYTELYGHENVVMDVATSADGRLMVSGAEDHTVCLWNLNTGELLLRLFMGVDGKWVAWCKDAEIYKASPGGEKLLGWHIDRGLRHLSPFRRIASESKAESSTWQADLEWLQQICRTGRVFDPIEDLTYENPEIAEFLQRYPTLGDALRLQQELPKSIDVSDFVASLDRPAPTAEAFLSQIQQAPINGLFGLTGKLKITNKTSDDVMLYSVFDDGGRSLPMGKLAPGESINEHSELGHPWRAMAGFETVAEFRMPLAASAEWSIPNNDRIQLLGEEPVLQIESAGHTAICSWLGFSLDGSELISAGDDKVVRIWDVSDPVQQPRLKRSLRGDLLPEEGMISCAALCPRRTTDGRRVLAVGGTLLAAGENGNHSVVRLFDYETGQVLALLESEAGGEDGDQTYDLAFSPDGRFLAVVDADEWVSVWDLKPLFDPSVELAREQLQQAISVLDPILSGKEWRDWGRFLRFDDLRRQVAGVTKPDLTSLTEILAKFSGDQDTLQSANFVRTRDALKQYVAQLRTAGISADWLEAVHDSMFEITLEDPEYSIGCVAFVPAGDARKELQLALGGSGAVRLWKFASPGDWIEVDRTKVDVRISDIECSLDGRFLFTVNDLAQVVRWDTADLQRSRILAEGSDNDDEASPARLSLSPDGRSVVICDNCPVDPVCRVIPTSGAKQIIFKGHNNTIFAAVHAPQATDGQPLVATTGGDRQDIVLWNPATGEEVKRIVGSGRPVLSLGFSADGRRIAFGHDFFDEDAEVASINNQAPLALTLDLTNMEPAGDAEPPPPGGWRRAVEESDGFTAELDGESDYERLVVSHDGIELGEIELEDVLQCYTLVPGQKTLIAGTGHRLYVYDLEDFENSDSITWFEELAGHIGQIQCAAVSPDGSLLVSGGYDQTIRVWDLQTLEPLVTVFMAHDGAWDGEWVAWTDAGFYKSSPAGGQLIGWHLNQGEDRAATFIHASQLREQYDQPEIIDRLFHVEDQKLIVRGIDQAIMLYNEDFSESRRKQDVNKRAHSKNSSLERSVTKLAPPIIEILEPREGLSEKEEVTLRFRVLLTPETMQQERILYIRVMNEGRPVDQWEKRSVPTEEAKGEFALTVKLKPGSQKLSVLAWTENEVSSHTQSVAVISPTAVDPEKQKPDLLILTIGVSKYREDTLNLAFADKDAEGLHKAFQSQNGAAFASVELISVAEGKPLTNDSATAKNIKIALADLAKKANAKTNAIVCVCIAGHGIEDETGTYFFVPHDYERKLAPGVTGIRWTEFMDPLQRMHHPVVLLMDTCHSASVTGESSLRSESHSLRRTITELTDDKYGVNVLASSLSAQKSQENPDWAHGVFTYAVLEALSGKTSDVASSGAPTAKRGFESEPSPDAVPRKKKIYDVPPPDADGNGTVDLREPAELRV